MAKPLDDLVALMRLDRLGETRFRGQSQDPGWGTVFGGQVLGQGLSAAIETVPAERRVHSLHAYFLRPGDVDRPIDYEVDRIRDSRSFTTRRVVAHQGGPAIFAMSCSFHVEEPGLEHQTAMPPARGPETLPTDQERLAQALGGAPEAIRAKLLAERPFEVRTTAPEGEHPLAPDPRDPWRSIWVRAIDALPDDPALHACLLAYVSDYQFMTTALAPHGVSWMSPSVQLASIDHAMWFHRPFRCDDWLLHVMESPTAQAARGFVRGQVFTRDGRLIASTAQEGLIRQRL